jgi:hypothetical protein
MIFLYKDARDLENYRNCILLVFTLLAGTPQLVMSVLIPLYVVNFHRYPVDEAHSSKDFILNLASTLLESQCARPRSPRFTRGCIFFWSVETAEFAVKSVSE